MSRGYFKKILFFCGRKQKNAQAARIYGLFERLKFADKTVFPVRIMKMR